MQEAKKKLLITASTFPRFEKDTEPRFILDLAKEMTKYFDVTVLVPADKTALDEEILEGVRVKRYHYFPVRKWETLCYPGAIVPRIKEKKIRIFLVPFLFISLYAQMRKIIKDYDVVHAHWIIPQGIVQSYFKKPYIITGHGGDVTSLNSGPLRLLKRRCLKRAGYVTVVSSHLKEKVIELCPGIQPSIISMGVDTGKFGRQYRIDNYFGQGNRPVILFVGRLAEKKGVAYLIDAYESVIKEADARGAMRPLLVIVGDGPLMEGLRKQAQHLEGDVVFLGAKSHEELKTIYASADIFAAPSVTAQNGDQEGLPTTILEAMASGLAVVASSHGGIKELIENGGNGILVQEKNSRQLAEGINRLLYDEQLRQKVLQQAAKTVEKYDYEELGRQYAQVLRNII